MATHDGRGAVLAFEASQNVLQVVAAMLMTLSVLPEYCGTGVCVLAWYALSILGI